MNCEEANQIDMVDYLNAIGYQPQKIRGNDYWYYSAFREEKKASFKVNKSKNVWYDHGHGKGGRLIDFVMEFYRCNVIYILMQKGYLLLPIKSIKLFQTIVLPGSHYLYCGYVLT